MTCKNGLQAAVLKRERGQGFDPPFPRHASDLIEIKIVIQIAATTTARIVRTGIQKIDTLPTVYVMGITHRIRSLAVFALWHSQHNDSRLASSSVPP